jgi:hypothetical protein
MGSSRVADPAGMKHASNVTVINSTATVPSVAGDPGSNPNRDDDQPVSEEQSPDVIGRRAECPAYADLLPALAHALRDDSVQPDRR